MIIAPTGEVIASLDSKEGVVSAEIHYDFLAKVRQNFPVLNDAKPFFSFPIKNNVI